MLGESREAEMRAFASEDEMEIWAGVTSSPDYPTSDEEEPIDTSKQ